MAATSTSRARECHSGSLGKGKTTRLFPFQVITSSRRGPWALLITLLTFLLFPCAALAGSQQSVLVRHQQHWVVWLRVRFGWVRLSSNPCANWGGSERALDGACRRLLRLLGRSRAQHAGPLRRLSVQRLCPALG
jgi:hypothetical protein